MNPKTKRFESLFAQWKETWEEYLQADSKAAWWSKHSCTEYTYYIRGGDGMTACAGCEKEGEASALSASLRREADRLRGTYDNLLHGNGIEDIEDM